MKHLGITFIFIVIMSLSISAQEIGSQAPDFTLKDLQGQDFKLSDQIGKVVVIFFFGYDCAHCHSNSKNVQKEIYKYFSNRDDFVVIGIDGWNGTTSQVSDFKDQNNLGFKMLVDGAIAMTDYRTSPDHLFVIDQSGTIRYISIGFATEEYSVEARGVINSLFGITPVEEHLHSEIILYPNPAKDILTIQNPFSNTEKNTIELIDITGRQVLKKEIVFNKSSLSQINVSDFPNGLYIMRISNDTYSSVTKILVEK